MNRSTLNDSREIIRMAKGPQPRPWIAIVDNLARVLVMDVGLFYIYIRLVPVEDETCDALVQGVPRCAGSLHNIRPRGIDSRLPGNICPETVPSGSVATYGIL